jgi:hypothetical protein
MIVICINDKLFIDGGNDDKLSGLTQNRRYAVISMRDGHYYSVTDDNNDIRLYADKRFITLVEYRKNIITELLR